MSALEVNISQPSGSPLVTKPKNASVVKKPKLVRAPIKASPSKRVAKPKNASVVKKPKLVRAPIKASPSKRVAKPKNASVVKKPKLVRDSFAFPKDEHQAIDTLKKKALNLKRNAKKSEILRAGLKLLSSLNDTDFLLALAKVPALPTGQKKKKKRV
ncbi:MAG: hypothetical protein WCP13_01090 [Nitrosomonadaceae bacterium]